MKKLLRFIRVKFCSHAWKMSRRSVVQGELWTNYDYVCSKCPAIKWYG